MSEKNAVGKFRGSAEMAPAQKAGAAVDAKKITARNKKAAYGYFLEDHLEADPSLTRTEIKVLRMGRASLSEVRAKINRGEAWLQGANTPEYLYGSRTNHSPKRKRRLLLRKREILRLENGVVAKGYMVIPVELYFIGGRAKVEIALARDKQKWNKCQTIHEREDNREA